MTIDLNTILGFIALLLLIGTIVFFTNSFKAKAKHGDTEISIDTKREKDNITVQSIDSSIVNIQNRPGQNINVDDVKNSNVNAN